MCTLTFGGFYVFFSSYSLGFWSVIFYHDGEKQYPGGFKRSDFLQPGDFITASGRREENHTKCERSLTGRWLVIFIENSVGQDTHKHSLQNIDNVKLGHLKDIFCSKSRAFQYSVLRQHPTCTGA